MVDVETPIAASSATSLNVADRLAAVARQSPGVTAVACPARWSPSARVSQRGNSGAAYATITFGELDADATRIARGLITWGVPPRTRIALLVRPGIDFVALVFGLLRAGMVIVLVDPGMGRRNLIRCLAEAEPEGFIAISAAHAIRQMVRRKFPRARWNVTVGRRWFWGGLTLKQLRQQAENKTQMEGCGRPTQADDPAAIIFTSGSTGPPKGVLYTQRMFDTQVSEIQPTYGIEPGGVDLACFPLFALFNSAMGVTTVFPEMDFSRPAAANPEKLLAAANDWQVTQAFASPAVWRVLSVYCAKTGARIDSLRQVFSCGAPVSADVLRATLACVGPGAKMHTPYGATECLPVATIEAADVLGETAARTEQGGGVCVGRKFDSIDWKIINITDEPVESIDDAEELSRGEIGELIVRGPQVSPRYVTQTECNDAAKINNLRAGASSPPIEAEDRSARHDPSVGIETWHRTGDVGYFDEQSRFWYCGRKAQPVETTAGPLYTECVEAIFNSHPSVRRCALVGVGKRGAQVPVLIVERDSARDTDRWRQDVLEFAQEHPGTRAICEVLSHPSLPVDVRHNAKINREQLAEWATQHLGKTLRYPPAL